MSVTPCVSHQVMWPYVAVAVVGFLIHASTAARMLSLVIAVRPAEEAAGSGQGAGGREYRATVAGQWGLVGVVAGVSISLKKQ